MCENKNDGNKDNTTKAPPHFTYEGEPMQMVQSFKILGINVPLTNRWNVCCESRHQAGLAHGMK